MLNLVSLVEEQFDFEIDDETAEKLVTVGDLVHLIARKIEAKH
jgi:acyl carrier protein